MAALSCKRPHVARRLLRRIADHVDHDIKPLIRKPVFERSKIVAIAGNLLHALPDAILLLPAIEHDDIDHALCPRPCPQLLDNPRADQTRSADDENTHMY